MDQVKRDWQYGLAVLAELTERFRVRWYERKVGDDVVAETKVGSLTVRVSAKKIEVISPAGTLYDAYHKAPVGIRLRNAITQYLDGSKRGTAHHLRRVVENLKRDCDD